MRNRRVWVGIFLFTLTCINYVDRVVLAVCAVPIMADFGLTPVQMGYLLSSFLWAYVLCLIPVGVLADRIGGKATNAAGVALWSTATVLTGFSPSFLFMGATRILMGIGESTTWPASTRVVREWFPASERGLYSALFGAGASAGPAIGAAALSLVVGRFGWRIGFYAAGGVGFVWLALWLLLFDAPERTRWLSDAEKDLILRERDSGVSPAQSTRPSSPLAHLLRQRSVWGFFLTQMCLAFIGYMLLGWLPSYLQRTRGLSIAGAGLLTALPFAGAAVLAVLIGMASDRLLTPARVRAGQRRWAVAAMLLAGTVILPVTAVRSLWAILLIFALACGASFAASSLNFALVADLVRNRADIGKVTGITAMGGNLSGVIAPIATGYIVTATGSFDAAFALAGGLAALGFLVVVAMLGRPIEPDPSEPAMTP